MKKRTLLALVFHCNENKEKHPIYVSQKCCEEKDIDLLLIGEEGKWHDFLTKNLIRSFMIIVYIVEKKIVVIVYKLSVQKKD